VPKILHFCAFFGNMRDMKRDILNKLLDWRNSSNRKPLILTGARQVGKTWAMKEFGRQFYKNTAYIMFEKNENMQKLFEGSLSPKGLLPFLQAEAGVAISPSDTLIVFDEVQAVPNAITSLKFFQEEAPEYSIVAAGSTLGVTLHDGGLFPVGKVDFATLHPMTFLEFLEALGESQLVELAKTAKDLAKINIFHEKLEKYLRQYFLVGGMPEVVKKYAETGSFDDVRNIQENLLNAYEEDFSKYATPLTATKLHMLWRSIPSQITKENRRFIYGAVKGGARARDFEVTIEWLMDSSLVNKVNRVSAPKQPLKAYEDFGAFKLYLHDIGLLGALAGVLPRAIVDDTTIYTEFKGALAEQFVAQELAAHGKKLFYWSSDDSRQEVDFLMENNDGVVPIEVKSGRSLSSVSFARFMQEHNSPYGFKVSTLPYNKSERVVNLPLYLAFVAGEGRGGWFRVMGVN
jgi:predicted AAA+ superfamily ATPase